MSNELQTLHEKLDKVITLLELLRRLDSLEKEHQVHSRQIQLIFQVLRRFLSPESEPLPEPEKFPMGFRFEKS
ncbi:MAG: hypothetical protein HGB19_00260 [Chlorobiales bacterium]|jgi:hypothetical protein|nr:hypothetical protein [Chlorobiales bacterium]